MDNYTPLNIEKLDEKKEDNTNTLFLLIADIAAAILAILLFILIQNKLK